MANRNFNRKQALEREIKELYLDVAIGASGAPTLTRGTGVASISRSSAGTYLITLQDAYMRLMSAQTTQVVSAVESLAFQVSAEDVAGAKTIIIHSHTAGVATDPSSGSRLLIQLNLKNSSVV